MSLNDKIPYTREELFAEGEQRSYTGNALKEIAFPLGGIGAGTVSLGGRGQLRDWEIFNRPAKGKIIPYTFPAIYAKTASGEPIARVLESKMLPPFIVAGGMPPDQVCGLPRLENAVFKGEYPFAHINFEDSRLPVEVELTAFNPFIPLSEKDSAIPTAVLRYKVTNHGKEKVDVTICWSLINYCGYDGVGPVVRHHSNFTGQLNEFVDDGTYRGIRMTQSHHPEDDLRFGSMALATTYKDVTHQAAWTRDAWWNDCQNFWDDFKADGAFSPNGANTPGLENTADIASLGLKASLEPGQSAELPFIFSWYFPNRENYWGTEPGAKGAKLKNHYANLFKNAWDAAGYTAKNMSRLETQSADFRDALYKSTLPATVLDAAGANMSIMRTQNCMWLDNDRFFGFEGLGDSEGCCPMNCTHVWNYEQAVAFLFPRLERTMRLTDFTQNVEEDGKMAFRTALPLGKHKWNFHAAADGQMGCILKYYREYLISGDEEFLKLIYPAAQHTMSFVWLDWDKDQDGVMESIQHNTYDIEFLGPNTMMGTLYLGALKVMELIATHLGDADYAAKCRTIFEKGSAKQADELWNGEYFIQVYDPDKAPKYQYGPGCLADQLLGQWFCEVVGLGNVLCQEKVKSALASVFKYNWRGDLSDHDSVQRTYALNDEAGLLLCTWPKGGRPALPFTYADEVWTGIEYQVAAHLIYEDMLEEGLAIVKGVRDRHDGTARNPWDEFECGHHYARAMSSWSLLLALSGFHYSAPQRHIEFAPKVQTDDFKCFYSAGSGWGTYFQKQTGSELTASIAVTWGELKLKSVKLRANASSVRVSVGGREITAKLEASQGWALVTLSEEIKVPASEKLEIKIEG